jgi:2-dehydropantoate 2-reductase
MNISVIGPGALGCLFAAKLLQAGHQITLIDHRKDRVEYLRKQGIIVEDQKNTFTTHPQVSCTVPKSTDMILVLTKAHATHSLNLPSNALTLTLQNGLGNAEIIAEKVGKDSLLAGTTALAVTKLAEGHIRYVASGVIKLGAWATANPLPIIRILQEAGFEVEHAPNPAATIWQKAIINAAINPLTALLNVPNGRLLELDETRSMLFSLLEEAAQVAALEGFPQEENPKDLALKICEATAENISSMLQDIRNGKPTEIDALSGELVRRAEKHDVTIPNTQIILRLVRGLEQR